jgi:hypothetical protein
MPRFNSPIFAYLVTLKVLTRESLGTFTLLFCGHFSVGISTLATGSIKRFAFIR